MALVDADSKFIWADMVSPGTSFYTQIYNEPELKEMAECGIIGFPTLDAVHNDYMGVLR